MAGTPKTTLLIIGKVGNGKSSTGNSILGRDGFQVTHGFTSTDLTCQVEEDENKSMKIICAPDLQHLQFCKKKDQPDLNPRAEIESWLQHGTPDAVVMVIRCDQRFTDGEYESYTKLKQSRLGDLMGSKLVIVFTMGDRLCGRDLGQELLERKPEMKKVQSVWTDANYRYVVFDNTADRASKDVQVHVLLYIIKTMKPHPFPQQVCRLLVIGEADNIKRLRDKVPKVKTRLDEKDLTTFLTTTVSPEEDSHIRGIKVEIVLTTRVTGDANEDLNLTDTALIAISPGPHVILYDEHEPADLPTTKCFILRHDFHRLINDHPDFHQLLLKITELVQCDIEKRCGQVYQSPRMKSKTWNIYQTMSEMTSGAKDGYERYLRVKCAMSGADDTMLKSRKTFCRLL